MQTCTAFSVFSKKNLSPLTATGFHYGTISCIPSAKLLCPLELSSRLMLCFMWAHVWWLLLADPYCFIIILSSSASIHCIWNYNYTFFFFSPALYLTFKLTGTKTGTSFSCQHHLSWVFSQSMDQRLYTSQKLRNTIFLPAKVVKVQMCEEFHFNSTKGIKDI